MAVKCALLWIIFSLSEAAITSTPNSISECSGMSINLKWVYEESNIVVVEWNFGGNLMLQYIPSQPPGSQHQYSNGYTSAKVGHISNGEINISSLTASDSGSYSCKTTYSAGSPLTFETQMTLTVSDMISTNLTCSHNQSTGIIDCSVIPSSITSLTINGDVHLTSSLPINGTGSETYIVCMAGDASNCRNDGIQQCITLEGKTSQGDDKKGLPTGAIVAIILVVVAIVCVALFVLIKIKEHKKTHQKVKVNVGDPLKFGKSLLVKNAPTNTKWTRPGLEVEPNKIKGTEIEIRKASKRDEGLYVLTFGPNKMEYKYTVIVSETKSANKGLGSKNGNANEFSESKKTNEFSEPKNADSNNENAKIKRLKKKKKQEENEKQSIPAVENIGETQVSSQNSKKLPPVENPPYLGSSSLEQKPFGAPLPILSKIEQDNTDKST